MIKESLLLRLIQDFGKNTLETCLLPRLFLLIIDIHLNETLFQGLWIVNGLPNDPTGVYGVYNNSSNSLRKEVTYVYKVNPGAQILPHLPTHNRVKLYKSLSVLTRKKFCRRSDRYGATNHEGLRKGRRRKGRKGRRRKRRRWRRMVLELLWTIYIYKRYTLFCVVVTVVRI